MGLTLPLAGSAHRAHLWHPFPQRVPLTSQPGTGSFCSSLFYSLVVLLVSLRPAMAQDAAGRIVSATGKVEVFRAQQWQPVGLRDVLMPGDVVRTGPGSRVAILLSDESQIKVNANSILEIMEVRPPPGRPVRAALGHLRTILNLLKGEVWSRSHGKSFQIRTPAATATIRGTGLDLSIGPDNESRLAVLEGTVEFRNPRGAVFVKAGEGGNGEDRRTPQ